MKSIADFPAEIWTKILDAESDSHLVLLLLQCGCAALIRKLLTSVDRIDLKDGNPNSSSTFPRLLSRFTKLRYLSLDRDFNYLWSSDYDLAAKFCKIQTSKLETLKLCSFQWMTILENPWNADTIPHQTEGMLASKFGSLTTLVLTGDHVLELQASRLCILPPTLTHLATPDVQVGYDQDAVMQSLPRALLTWDTKLILLFNVQSQFWVNPPPSLHTISVLDIEQTSIVDFGFLPPSLKHCRIDGLRNTPAAMSTLPASLETTTNVLFDLELCMLPNWKKQLPPKLQNLGIQQTASRPATASAVTTLLSDLPPYLTCLMLPTQNAPWDLSLVTPKHWPSTLTDLNLSLLLHTTLNLQCLPSTLKMLTFEDVAVERFAVNLLPKGLQSLTIVPVETSRLAFTGSFPPTLTLISITGYPQLIFSIESFPESLRFLELQKCDIRIRDANDVPGAVPKLPSGLLKLTVGTWNFPHLCEIPASVTDLYIGNLRLFPSKEDTISKDCFSVLPHGLERLFIGSSTSNTDTFWGSASFSSLQRLKELDVLALGAFDPAIIGKLPKRLRTVRLNVTHLKVAHQAVFNPLWLDHSIQVLKA